MSLVVISFLLVVFYLVLFWFLFIAFKLYFEIRFVVYRLLEAHILKDVWRTPPLRKSDRLTTRFIAWEELRFL